MRRQIRQAEIPCVVCAGDLVELLYRPKSSPGPVVRCLQCGLVYISPRQEMKSLIVDGPVLPGNAVELLTSHSMDDLKGSWEWGLIQSKQAEYPAARLNHQAALSMIGRYTSSPGRLLDFGCGAGFFLSTAKESGWDVYGLEPLPGHAIYSRATFDVPVATDILRPGAFPSDHFDVITAFQVFEHLPDPNVVLSELARILKPGGLILVEVPNIDTWSVRLFGPRHRHYVQDHIYFFSAQTLSALFGNYGLQVLDTWSPGRRMSLHYLVQAWGKRYLSRWLTAPAQRLLDWLGIGERVVVLNFGDIVSVIGRKPAGI